MSTIKKSYLAKSTLLSMTLAATLAYSPASHSGVIVAGCVATACVAPGVLISAGLGGALIAAPMAASAKDTTAAQPERPGSGRQGSGRQGSGRQGRGGNDSGNSGNSANDNGYGPRLDEQRGRSGGHTDHGNSSGGSDDSARGESFRTGQGMSTSKKVALGLLVLGADQTEQQVNIQNDLSARADLGEYKTSELNQIIKDLSRLTAGGATSVITLNHVEAAAAEAKSTGQSLEEVLAKNLGVSTVTAEYVLTLLGL